MLRRSFQIRGFQIVLVALIAGLFGFLAGTYKIDAQWKNFKPIVSVQSATPPTAQSIDLALVHEVIDRLNREYYDKSKLDSQKLLYGAVSGMLESLDDPYTSFFPPKENQDFKENLAGEFSGIGAELGMKDNKIMVVAPLDESPAQKAGVRAGDLIIKVNGKDTAGWTIPQAVENIRGPKGSQVELSVLHEKEKEAKNIKITRDTIVIHSVTGWFKNIECSGSTCVEKKDCTTCATVAYIRLSQFGDKTNDEWATQIGKILPEIQKSRNFKGLVLDLRNNPGGYLTDAVFIASEFVDSGAVVLQEDATGRRDALNVNRNGQMLETPVVVLINKGSASASEIVAGALRDHKRAQLIGDTSFGKGTIQQAVDVDQGASVHISVAKWLTPEGTWVHQKGLEPDIKVTLDATASAEMIRNNSGFDNQLQRAIQELL